MNFRQLCAITIACSFCVNLSAYIPVWLNELMTSAIQDTDPAKLAQIYNPSPYKSRAHCGL